MEDEMHMIGHHDAFVQFNGGKTLRKRLPRIFHNVTHFGHLKIWLTPLQAHGHEIGSRLAIIVAFETKRTPVELFWIVTHRHRTPLQGCRCIRYSYVFLYPSTYEKRKFETSVDL